MIRGGAGVGKFSGGSFRGGVFSFQFSVFSGERGDFGLRAWDLGLGWGIGWEVLQQSLGN